jgi:hypothetical protein
MQRPGCYCDYCVKGRFTANCVYSMYRTNVPLYPKWQAFLKQRQPNTIVFWGQGDVFFTPEGGDAYLADLPNAEMHPYEVGHFAVEACPTNIFDNMHRSYNEKWRENKNDAFTTHRAAVHIGKRNSKSSAGARRLELARPRTRSLGLLTRFGMAQSHRVPPGPRRNQSVPQAEMGQRAGLPFEENVVGIP